MAWMCPACGGLDRVQRDVETSDTIEKGFDPDDKELSTSLWEKVYMGEAEVGLPYCPACDSTAVWVDTVDPGSKTCWEAEEWTDGDAGLKKTGRKAIFMAESAKAAARNLLYWLRLRNGNWKAGPSGVTAILEGDPTMTWLVHKEEE